MTRYALVVGVARYDNFRNLDKAATDAAAIAHILQVHGRYQVKPSPRRLVKPEDRWELDLDKKLTAKDLSQDLEEFLLDQAEGHEALIYFAGHGFELTELGRTKKGYLATSDCKKDDVGSAISFNGLNDLIQKSRLSSLVMILDCCNAGSFLERTLLDSALTAFNGKQDYYLITACRSFERAREGEEHGVFTASVLKGLQAANADSEGAVTGDRLFDFIQRDLRQSGQEPIRTGTGRSIALVNYQPQVKTVTAIVDERGEIICPYQGLQAFTAKQQKFFFGRKQDVELIRQKLEKQPFVPVIGASGSGKSSLVRAGLMPWLSESGWHILEPIKPGFEPLAALRGVFEPFFKRSRSEIQTLHHLIDRDPAGLSGVIERLSKNSRYLLVVDQFEEVFTVCADKTEQQRFIELITQIAETQNSRLAVVTTMRADFLEPCLHHPSLHRLIQSQAVYMTPLDGINLRDVIVEPAKLQGYTIEEALLLKFVEDVGKEPGFLPLLEFVLTKLWEKRDTDNHLLTLEQYEKLGGLTGALNLHAERIYLYQDYKAESPSDKRGEQEQAWIKRIFLRLIRTGEGEKDTRQRQPKASLLTIGGDALATQEALRELIDGEGGLVRERLLFSGQETYDLEPWVDLAHEALMDGWRRFAEWRKENRELRRLTDRLEDANREWLHNKQDSQFLLMGGFLGQVREQWQKLEPDLNSSVRKFYDFSNQYEHDQIAEKERQNQITLTMYRYMPQELIEEVLRSGNDKLGGERKEVSVLTSSILDYTTLTEILAAEEVVKVLNEYFELMVDAIAAHKGTPYRYTDGGGIMAVFGSLILLGNGGLLLGDHEWMSGQTAVEMRYRLMDFNAKRQSENKKTIKIGIGINSGTVISGNIGSSRRMEFTVTGNEVSLSSTLGEANEQYGTDILISESTYRPCADRFWTRELDFIRVKGKNNPVAIYELVGLRSETVSDQKQHVIEHYEKARRHYLNRKFVPAVAGFATVLEIDSHDKAAALHMERCQHWLRNPPTDDWDGAWIR